jgi:hypothetical protein
MVSIHQLRNRRSVAFLVVFTILCLSIGAQERPGTQRGYLLDLPPGWTAADVATDGLHTYTGPNGQGVLQVVRYGADAFGDARGISDHLQGSLAASGEVASFRYNGNDATLGDIQFAAGAGVARGYLLTMETNTADYALIAYASARTYRGLHDHLLSALESFSPNLRGRRRPGPVSQFYYPFPGSNTVPCELDIAGQSVRIAVDEGEIDANQVLIEREARILVSSAVDLGTAWTRYYRQIYRDTHPRIARYAETLASALNVEAAQPRRTAEDILRWLQGFKYVRTGTLSDLQSPLASLCVQTGDCDSLGLLYISLLHAYGIDAILLVSERFGHSLVGVDVPGPGARLPFMGTSYVLAELTDQVDLGLIPQSMADPTGWRPIRFTRR